MLTHTSCFLRWILPLFLVIFSSLFWVVICFFFLLDLILKINICTHPNIYSFSCNKKNLKTLCMRLPLKLHLIQDAIVWTVMGMPWYVHEALFLMIGTGCQFACDTSQGVAIIYKAVHDRRSSYWGTTCLSLWFDLSGFLWLHIYRTSEGYLFCSSPYFGMSFP